MGEHSSEDGVALEEDLAHLSQKDKSVFRKCQDKNV